MEYEAEKQRLQKEANEKIESLRRKLEDDIANLREQLSAEESLRREAERENDDLERKLREQSQLMEDGGAQVCPSLSLYEDYSRDKHSFNITPVTNIPLITDLPKFYRYFLD